MSSSTSHIVPYSNAYSVVFAVTSFHRWPQLEEVCLIHVYVPSSYYRAQHTLNKMFQINANGILKQPTVETVLKAGRALQPAPCMQCHFFDSAFFTHGPGDR